MIWRNVPIVIGDSNTKRQSTGLLHLDHSIPPTINTIPTEKRTHEGCVFLLVELRDNLSWLQNFPVSMCTPSVIGFPYHSTRRNNF